MLEDELVFANDDSTDDVDCSIEPEACWRILVVDDEVEIHHVTRLVLQEFIFEGRAISMEFASSAQEARAILAQDTEQDIALAIVDVVMETPHAGLDLIQWTRNSLQNHTIRLILRTGQPGEAPEEKVIQDYDINDYKNKTELTALRLKTTVFAAIRSYRDIKIIQRHRQGLEKILRATSEFIACDSLGEFASAILNQISIILNIESSQIVCCAVTKEPDGQHPARIKVLAANNSATRHAADKTFPLSFAVERRIETALLQKHTLRESDYFVGYFTTKRGTENILYVENESALDAVQHQLLDSFAHNIAVAHENLKLREEIKESQKELSYIIGEAVEMRSKETGSHVKRVALLSYRLAKLYGLSEQEAEMIKLASPLHDVGKVGIPDQILNKPAKHNEEERKNMQSHARIGFEMLSKSDNPILKMGAHIAHEHHENWDGSGYPRGLSGYDIQIAGRISSVADVFDALGSKRCYKGSWEEAEITAYFEQEKGKKFEPKLVDLLLSHLDDFLAVRKSYPDPDSENQLQSGS